MNIHSLQVKNAINNEHYVVVEAFDGLNLKETTANG